MATTTLCSLREPVDYRKHEVPINYEQGAEVHPIPVQTFLTLISESIHLDLRRPPEARTVLMDTVDVEDHESLRRPSPETKRGTDGRSVKIFTISTSGRDDTTACI